MIRFEPRADVSALRAVATPVAAGLAALVIASSVLVLVGAPVVGAFLAMLDGAAGSVFAVSETLTRATPLIFTGLAAAVAFRAKLWNIGAEGQLYAGALAAVTLGTGLLAWPVWALLPAVMLAGAAAGAFVLTLSALARARLGADEVVTTLLMNFVVLLFVQMMLEGPLKDPMGLGWPQSEPMLPEATLPVLIDRMRTHAGLIVALIAAVAVHILLTRTVWGFEIRATGDNPDAARFAGMPATGTILRVALISGGLAGLCGVSEVAGLKGYLTADMSPGFGYAGIVVAILAGLSPLGVVPAAIFVAGVFVGADTMSRAVGVSNYFADLVVALALICVLIGGLLTRYRIVVGRGAA